MPELSIGGLYQRIRAAASAHLGERSPSTLHAYVSGYDDGLAHYGAAPLVEELPYAQFRGWVTLRDEPRLVRAAAKHFGSWRDTVEAAGFCVPPWPLATVATARASR